MNHDDPGTPADATPGPAPDPELEAALDARLATVALDREPARDLWPGIAARLEPRSGAASGADVAPAGAAAPSAQPARARTRWPYALAASLALVATTALITRQIDLRSTAPGAATTPVAAADTARLVRAAFETPQGEAYLRTRAALEATFQERLTLLAPETRTRILQNLQIIKQANENIRSALAQDPASPVLHQLLESTWQQEIDLYTNVSEGTEPALSRTQT